MSTNVIDNEAYGQVMESGAVRFERLLPGPIERVWDYITDSEKRGRWLGTGEMDLRIGGRVDFHFMHANLSPVKETPPEKYKSMECGGSIFGHITQLEVPRLLTITWNERPGIVPSEVTFELTPQGKDVLLVLTHRRITDKGEMLSTSAGWHVHLGILIDALNERAPLPFWSAHERMELAYAKRLPA